MKYQLVSHSTPYFRLISETGVHVADENMVFNVLGDLVRGGKKKKQEEVGYGIATEKNVRCSTCKNFDEKEKTCMRVEGKVHPDAVCKLWEKAGADEDPSSVATPTVTPTP